MEQQSRNSLSASVSTAVSLSKSSNPPTRQAVVSHFAAYRPNTSTSTRSSPTAFSPWTTSALTTSGIAPPPPVPPRSFVGLPTCNNDRRPLLPRSPIQKAGARSPPASTCNPSGCTTQPSDTNGANFKWTSQIAASHRRNSGHATPSWMATTTTSPAAGRPLPPRSHSPVMPEKVGLTQQSILPNTESVLSLRATRVGQSNIAEMTSSAPPSATATSFNQPASLSSYPPGGRTLLEGPYRQPQRRFHLSTGGKPRSNEALYPNFEQSAAATASRVTLAAVTAGAMGVGGPQCASLSSSVGRAESSSSKASLPSNAVLSLDSALSIEQGSSIANRRAEQYGPESCFHRFDLRIGSVDLTPTHMSHRTPSHTVQRQSTPVGAAPRGSPNHSAGRFPAVQTTTSTTTSVTSNSTNAVQNQSQHPIQHHQLIQQQQQHEATATRRKNMNSAGSTLMNANATMSGIPPTEGHPSHQLTNNATVNALPASNIVVAAAVADLGLPVTETTRQSLAKVIEVYNAFMKQQASLLTSLHDKLNSIQSSIVASAYMKPIGRMPTTARLSLVSHKPTHRPAKKEATLPSTELKKTNRVAASKLATLATEVAALKEAIESTSRKMTSRLKRLEAAQSKLADGSRSGGCRRRFTTPSASTLEKAKIELLLRNIVESFSKGNALMAVRDEILNSVAEITRALRVADTPRSSSSVSRKSTSFGLANTMSSTKNNCDFNYQATPDGSGQSDSIAKSHWDTAYTTEPRSPSRRLAGPVSRRTAEAVDDVRAGIAKSSFEVSKALLTLSDRLGAFFNDGWQLLTTNEDLGRPELHQTNGTGPSSTPASNVDDEQKRRMQLVMMDGKEAVRHIKETILQLIGSPVCTQCRGGSPPSQAASVDKAASGDVISRTDFAELMTTAKSLKDEVGKLTQSSKEVEKIVSNGSSKSESSSAATSAMAALKSQIVSIVQEQSQKGQADIRLVLSKQEDAKTQLKEEVQSLNESLVRLEVAQKLGRGNDLKAIREEVRNILAEFKSRFDSLSASRLISKSQDEKSAQSGQSGLSEAERSAFLKESASLQQKAAADCTAAIRVLKDEILQGLKANVANPMDEVKSTIQSTLDVNRSLHQAVTDLKNELTVLADDFDVAKAALREGLVRFRDSRNESHEEVVSKIGKLSGAMDADRSERRKELDLLLGTLREVTEATATRLEAQLKLAVGSRDRRRIDVDGDTGGAVDDESLPANRNSLGVRRMNRSVSGGAGEREVAADGAAALPTASVSALMQATQEAESLSGLKKDPFVLVLSNLAEIRADVAELREQIAAFSKASQNKEKEGLRRRSWDQKGQQASEKKCGTSLEDTEESCLSSRAVDDATTSNEDEEEDDDDELSSLESIRREVVADDSHLSQLLENCATLTAHLTDLNEAFGAS